MIRAAVPGVLWLWIVDARTGEQRRGHVALPLHQQVGRHARATASDARRPDDA
ncbi:hypothetical protein GCM10022237_33550 [Nocardioides ginsengisoli]|uniref:Uncharacterized protein n=1 Tax=Nocardioides ginsengisoli TaxID=363868 RepID=A0ABW3VX30_9ACTN